MRPALSHCSPVMPHVSCFVALELGVLSSLATWRRSNSHYFVQLFSRFETLAGREKEWRSLTSQEENCVGLEVKRSFHPSPTSSSFSCNLSFSIRLALSLISSSLTSLRNFCILQRFATECSVRPEAPYMEVIRLVLWVVIPSRLFWRNILLSFSGSDSFLIAKRVNIVTLILLDVSFLMCAYALAVKNTTVRCVVKVFHDFQCLPKITRYIEL